MTLDVIKNMVYGNSYIYDKPQGIRCIDDRDDRQTNSSIDALPDIAIPGAGLGLLLGVLGGLHLLEEKGIAHNISCELAYKCAHEVTGGMPYDSDEKKVNDPNVAAGCDHFALALEHGEKYLISPEDINFIENKVLPSLAQKNGERVLYAGSHSAKAVIVIESPRLGVPSLLSNGDRVYVYSKHEHALLIDEVAYKISESVSASPERSVLREYFTKASEAQLASTLERLAPSLPVFEVTSSDKGDAVITLKQ